MKKITMLLLILTVSLGTAFATGQQEEVSSADRASNVNPPGVFPIVKEPIQVKMYITPGSKVIDIETNEAIKYIEELTGIELILTAGPEQAKEKVNLMLASQTDLPEVFLTYEAISMEQVALYGDMGVFEDITPYIEEWAPNLMNAFEYQPDIRKQITTPNGTIHSMAYYTEGQHVMHSQKMWVNFEWLDRLGLEEPETVEEFRAMLEAFKANDANGNGDPNDEIPLGQINDAWRVDLFGFLMNPFVPTVEWKETYLYNDGGTIKSSIQNPGWKEGLLYLRGLYDDGLLDQEAFVMGKAQMKALVMDPEGSRVGAIPAGAPGPFVNQAVPGPRDEFMAIAPLQRVDGGAPRTPYFKPKATPRFIVTSEAKNIEAIIRLGDLLMTDPFSGKEEDLERGLNVWYGPNGWRRAEAGELGNNGEQGLYAWTFNFNDATNINFANLGNLFGQKLKKGTLIGSTGDYNLEKILWNVTEEKYEPYSDPIYVPPVVIAAEDVSEAGELKQILQDYMKENNAKFVMGVRDIEKEWDTYLGELETLGLNRYIGMIQTAYDKQYK